MSVKTNTTARRLLWFTLAVDALLVAAYLGLAAAGPSVVRLFNVFDLNGEANPPSWWSGAQLLLIGAVLLVLAVRPLAEHPRIRPLKGAFITLGLVFVYLSLDEVGTIHEDISGLLRGQRLLPTFHGQGVWIFLYAIIGLAVAALIGRIMLRAWGLWRPQLLIGAGGFALLVFGGVFVEMIGYFISSTALSGYIETAVEESAEMAGASIVLFAVVSILGVVMGDLLRAPEAGAPGVTGGAQAD